eukprot:CAMPEP_0206018838 /NCGR_PEP_ID=MMETSP1464-20131121/27948_1 /ASSEMBLY_ACC=CAM_ASM_001124 /TAXON_ID=119497 /ORGANISM="Exanthemachrysis gayraliae, Strain RCC1523" /LENGTH=63 /DNA_ID=CAMNT_0053392727 /DNA_START=22 /DNA_END=213 /DNA_ORIENTATION=+
MIGARTMDFGDENRLKSLMIQLWAKADLYRLHPSLAAITYGHNYLAGRAGRRRLQGRSSIFAQ